MQKRMRRIISSVAYNIFPHYLTKGMISAKKENIRHKIIKHKMSVLIFSKYFSKNFPILRSIQRGIIINVKTSLCKELVILVRF